MPRMLDDPGRARHASLRAALRAALLAAALAVPAASCGPRDAQSPEALAGHWEGNVAHGDATLPVDLDVELSDGRLEARVTVPALLLRERPVEGFEFRSPKVRFRLPVGGETWTFDGWFRRSVISGTLSGGSLPRTLDRGRLPRLGLRRAAVRPGGVRADTVRFAGGGAPLAGTVFAPADSLAHPAVVLLQADDAATRADDLELAHRFARAGFVALAYDPRGRGASAGAPAASLADFELDAVEAAEFLRRRAGVDPARVGLCGRSHGGMLVPRVAARVRTAFAIAISPPGMPLREAFARRGGVPDWARAEAEADPAAPWAAVRVPALVLYGERDAPWPAAAGAARVREALEAARAGGRVETVARAGHALTLRPARGEPFDLPREAPGGLDTLLAWARRAAGLPPAPPPLVPPAR